MTSDRQGVPFRVSTLHIMCCHFLETLTFLLVHGFYGNAEPALNVLPYLNEDCIILIGHDQVDFT